MQIKTQPTPIKREIECLLDCVRYWARTDAERSVSTGDPDLDWDRVLSLAYQHGLETMFLQYLSETQRCVLVPAEPLKRLRQRCSDNVRRNMIMSGELIKVLDALQSAAIDAAPYKGHVLAQYLYGNMSMRWCWDVDVCVRQDDVPRAVEGLCALGFVPAVAATTACSKAFILANDELEFTGLNDGCILELHWRLSPRYFVFDIDTESAWQRMIQIPFGKRSVKTFCIEDLLLILCVHGAKHIWERLAWVADIARLVSTQTEIEWDQLLDRAASAGCLRMLCLGLYLAHDQCQIDLPKPVRDRCDRDPALRDLAAQVNARLFAPESNPISSVQRCRFNMAVRERLTDRLRFALFALAPSARDCTHHRLPPSLAVLFSLLTRPFRMLQRLYGSRSMVK